MARTRDGARVRSGLVRTALGFTLTVAAAPSALAQEGPPRPRDYDPSRDINMRTGRIPRGYRPADLEHPERWRYEPEQRLLSGSVFDRFLLTTFVRPILFREDDVGTGGGIGLTDINFRSQRFRELANVVASYSSEGQQAFRFNWRRWLHVIDVPGGGILREERSRVSAGGGYSKTLTRRFYGFGASTRDGDLTSYTQETADLGVSASFSLPEPGSDWIASFGAQLEHHNLARGRVSGFPSTNEVFGQTFSRSDNRDLLWLDTALSYDTRDSISNPYSGYRVGVGWSFAPLQTGGDIGSVFGADASAAFTVPPLFHDGGDPDEENPPTDVFAVGVRVQEAFGDLPFFSLPNLGGSSTLRGFTNNRFTDTAAAHLSAEYRFVISPRGVRLTDRIRIERFSLAMFYDGGTVASRLGSALSSRYRDSYGVGLRVGFARQALFRFDVGLSDEDVNVSIAFGNPF